MAHGFGTKRCRAGVLVTALTSNPGHFCRPWPSFIDRRSPQAAAAREDGALIARCSAEKAFESTLDAFKALTAQDMAKLKQV